MSKFLNSPKIQLFVIIILIGIAYSNIFQNGYQGDDYNVIFNWDFVHHIENIPKILTQNVFEKPFFRFRPIGTSLVAVYYHFFGANPFGYHIHSVVSHIIKTILVYLIAEKLIKLTKTDLTDSAKRWFPFIVALIFGLHPVMTESVTHVIVSLDGTGYIFYLASFWCYLKSRSRIVRTFRYGIGDRWYWASLVLAGIAFFSYELTLTLPLMIVLYDFCFGSGLSLQAARHSGESSLTRRLQNRFWTSQNDKKTNSFRPKLSIFRYAPFFLLAFIYIGVRTALLHKLSEAHYLADSFYLTMLTMSRALVTYFGLLILPVNLSMNHSVLPGVMSWVDPFTNLEAIAQQSIFQVQILANLAVILGLVTTAIYFFSKKPLVSFAIGWVFISLLPVSYILPQDAIIQERFLHLGVLGFALIIGILVCELYTNLMPFEKSQGKRMHANGQILRVLLVFIFVGVLACYMVRTYIRNRDWKDDVAIYTSIVSQYPNSVMDTYMLASSYDRVGKTDEALKYYQKTLSLEPNVVNVYKRMAKIYEAGGDNQKAQDLYKKLLKLTPGDLAAQADFTRLSLKSLTDSSELTIKTENGYVGAIIEKSLFIFYPQNFSRNSIDKGVVLKDPKTSFVISIVLDSRNASEPFESFVKRQTQAYGSLLREGLAQIPNFEKAYVREWSFALGAPVDKQSGGSDPRRKLEFFLFKGEKVVKVLVYPADSPQMKIFEGVIGSLSL